MDFEDIVDMDWLNSHTIDSTSLPSPPFIKDEDFNMDYQHSFSSPHMETDQLVVQDAADAKDMMVMPTTEQIKQLIELAKRQLALREQLAAGGGGANNPIIAAEPTPEPESPPTTTISNCMLTAPMEPLIKIEDLYKSSALDTTLSPSATTHSTSTLAATITEPSATITTTTASSSSTCPAAAAATSTDIPDTVSPESLIKSEDTPLDNSKRECSHEAEGPISLEAYAETGGIDIKKLTSKERRQLRNKISARNFRVRRKGRLTYPV